MLQIIVLIVGLLFTSSSFASEQKTTNVEVDSPTLKVLKAFPRFYGDKEELAEDRDARLKEVADAVEAATNRPHERALLVTIIWHESRLARYVHFDEPPCKEGHKGRCDGGRAFGLPQLQGTKRDLTLPQQMERALKQLRFGAKMCKLSGDEQVKGAISVYATGSRCTWKDSTERLQTYKKVLNSLQSGRSDRQS